MTTFNSVSIFIDLYRLTPWIMRMNNLPGLLMSLSNDSDHERMSSGVGLKFHQRYHDMK